MLTKKSYQILTLGLFFLSMPFTSTFANTTQLDKVVAIVNNSALTQSQLNDTMQIITQQLAATSQPAPPAAELKKKALDQAIGEILQLQIAERANIKISDADVSNAITRIADGNHLTIDQFKEALQQQGIGYINYRRQIHDQLLLHTVQQQALGNKVHVTQADIQAYLKTAAANGTTLYQLDDLLIPLSQSPTQENIDAADKEVNDLIQQARSGVNFNQLTKGNVQHNDLQWRSLKELPDVFKSIVSQLKIGDIAGPIQAPNGFHILKLLDIKGPAKMTEAELKQVIFQQKLQEEAKKWGQELRKNAYVKII